MVNRLVFKKKSQTFKWSAVLLLSIASSAFSAQLWRAPVNKVCIAIPSCSPAEVSNIAKVFARNLKQRCNAEVVYEGDAPLKVSLTLKEGIGNEGFAISEDNAEITVTGNDVTGLLHGVGKLIRISRYDQGGFSAGVWRGSSVPEKPYRGMYWATHFKNTYDVGNMGDMTEYAEDMGLLGYNTLLIWYDMSHYKNLDDPESIKFLKRIVKYLQAAQDVGMNVGIVDISNHSFYDFAPQNLRATSGHAGNKPMDVHALYHVCPSIPEGWT